MIHEAVLFLFFVQARLDELREQATQAAAERAEQEGEGEGQEEPEEPEVTLGDEPIVNVDEEVANAVEKVGCLLVALWN